MSGIWPYLFIVVLILLSAFFSASEIAYASLSELYIRRLRAEGTTLRQKLCVKLYDGYEKALITILIGNNLVNIGSSSVATVIAVSLMGEDGAWIATAVMTVVILTFGEIIPKILATRFCREYSLLSAVPLYGLGVITKPLVWCVNRFLARVSRLWEEQADSGPAVTEDDLETIIETVVDEGVVDEDNADLLQSALDFGDVLAWEIITPRVDLFGLDLDDPPEKLADTLMHTNHSRIPVFRGSADNIIGILHLDRYLRMRTLGHEDPIGEAIRPARFVHKTMPIADALKIMQKEKCHMVVVTDEYGGTMGVLTMEDILEQLVGDIWDEGETVHEEFSQLGENLYEADGDMRLADFFDELEVEYGEMDEEDNATVGGWVIQMLEGYPTIGDSFTYDRLTVSVRRLQKHRVLSVVVRLSPEEKSEEAE